MKTMGCLRHGENMRWWRREDGAWPGNTEHAICQRCVYVFDLKPCRHVDRALKSAVLEFFHGIDWKRRICVGQKWRRGSVTGDGETTIMSQMNAYILFLETWKLERSGNEVRLRLITYLYAGTHGLLRGYPMLSSGYPPSVSEDKVYISCCKSTVERTVGVG